MEDLGYNVAYTVLSGIWVVPLSVIWFITLCMARQKGDPARCGIAWVKAIFPFWMVALICFTINGALSVYLTWALENRSSRYRIPINTISRTSSHISVIGGLFEYSANILLFFACTSLATGFLVCANGGAARGKAANVAMGVVSVVLLAVSVAWFGLNEAYLSHAWDSGTTAVSVAEMAWTTIRMNAAVKILMWVVSLGVMGYAAYAVHCVKRVQGLNKTASLLLAATVLSTTRLLALMAIYVHYFLAQPLVLNADPAIGTIAEPILNHAFMFVLLVLLFVLCARKPHSGGLWSQGGYGGPTPQGQYGQYAQEVVPPVAGMQQYHQQQQQGYQQQNGQPLPAYLQVAQQQQQQQQQGGYLYPVQQGYGNGGKV